MTNIAAAGGIGGLETIEAAMSNSNTTIVSSALDTPEAVPHKVAVDNDGFVFVTNYGGSANQLFVYSRDTMTGIPPSEGQFEVGSNPFGLAIVEYDRVNDVPSTTSSPVITPGSKSVKRGKDAKRNI